LGVSQDYLQATRWFAVAAEQGHALAQAHYCSACRQAGFAYRHGNGVPQSDDEAAKFFRWAAEEGDAESQTNLGIAYIEGRGVPQSDKDAVKWFSKAAKQGDDLAQFWLGTCYFSGRGVPQNHVEAYKWATLAAAQGGADPQKLQAELSAKLTPIVIQSPFLLQILIGPSDSRPDARPSALSAAPRWGRAAVFDVVQAGPFWGLCRRAGGRRTGATENKPNIAYVHPDPRSQLAGRQLTVGLGRNARPVPGHPEQLLVALDRA
jgi:hypothetical protein